MPRTRRTSFTYRDATTKIADAVERAIAEATEDLNLEDWEQVQCSIGALGHVQRRMAEAQPEALVVATGARIFGKRRAFLLRKDDPPHAGSAGAAGAGAGAVGQGQARPRVRGWVLRHDA